MADKTIYTKDSIESLDPRSHVRLRPGMYVGNTSNPNHLLVEIFSNALDEHNIGHGNVIKVDIEENGRVRVIDEGQGFPINQMREDGETVLQASFDVMNTSGKFSDDGVYSGSSLGLNGEGSKLSNFLSKMFLVSSWNHGLKETVYFEDGLFVERKVEKCEDSRASGTSITYIPDERFFDTNKTSVSYFEKFFNNIACLCNDLTIIFNNEKIKHDSISDMIDLNMPKKDIEILDNRFIYSNNTFKCALTFTSGSSSTIIPYVNYGITSVGPHISAIKSVVTRCFNKFARENHYLKKDDKNLDGNAIQEGMMFVCNIISKNVSYVAQVKSEISSLDTSFVSALGRELEIWLDNNPIEGGKIVEKAIVARKAAEAAKRARAAVKNKAEKKANNNLKMPTSLVDCYCKDRTKAELFVCEGRSPQGGLVAARNSDTQAIYSVRGKMLSVLKTKPENIIKNQEINNLIQALGLDFNPQNAKCIYDAEKLRYGKIIAAADADFDGYAIKNLLFNILWYICPELIINGHVYSSVPPLFRVTTKKNEYIYLKDAEELAAYKSKHGNEIAFIGREKGLGEMDSYELEYALLNKDTRNVFQLTVSDIEKTDKMFNDLYGKKVEPRVKFLSERSEEASE